MIYFNAGEKSTLPRGTSSTSGEATNSIRSDLIQSHAQFSVEPTRMERAHKKAVIAAREEDAVISIRTFPEGQTAGNDTNEEEEEEEATAAAAAAKLRRLISRSRFFFLSRFYLSLSLYLSLSPRGR